MSKAVLDSIQRDLDIIKSFYNGGVQFSGRITHPEKFLGEHYKLYYGVHDRDSAEYRLLRELIGRDTDIIWPKPSSRWYNSDADRELFDSGYNLLAREEYKYCYKIDQPFLFPRFGGSGAYQKYLTSTLVGSLWWLKSSVKNFSCVNTMNRGYGVNQESGDGANKGVVLYKFYTENLEYFSIINFTGVNYEDITEDGLEEVSRIIEPWASELFNFLVEAWVRRDYLTAYAYLSSGVERGLVRLNGKKVDRALVYTAGSVPGTWREKLEKQLWLEKLMMRILEIVSYGEILENPHQYMAFVDDIRSGLLKLDELANTGAQAE